MGVQDNFTTDLSLVNEAFGMSRTADTVSYITDLLSELSAIASISGLDTLSDDIDKLLSKHLAGSA